MRADNLYESVRRIKSKIQQERTNDIHVGHRPKPNAPNVCKTKSTTIHNSSNSANSANSSNSEWAKLASLCFTMSSRSIARYKYPYWRSFLSMTTLLIFQFSGEFNECLFMNLLRKTDLALYHAVRRSNFEMGRIAITYHASIFTVSQDANVPQT